MTVGCHRYCSRRPLQPIPLLGEKSYRMAADCTLIEPFADFFRRFGWNALLVLALIATYRISDIVMGIMANPFYVDMGYGKDEVAAVSPGVRPGHDLIRRRTPAAYSPNFGQWVTDALGAIL